MDESRLEVAQLGCHVSRHAEIRVLINGAWYQTWHVGATAERNVEGAGERRRRLNGGEGALADVVRHGEAEDCATLTHSQPCHIKTTTYSHLIIGRGFLYLENSGVHVLNVVQIRKDESFFHVEATRDDIFDVLECQTANNVISAGRKGRTTASHLWHFSSSSSFLNRNFSSSVI